MRRRLPAGLRSRLLIALLATSAVTLGVAALVVLPPLQDRLRDQTVETVQDAVADHIRQFDEAVAPVLAQKGLSTEQQLARTYAKFLDPVRALSDQSSARVGVLHKTLQSSVADGPTPAFLYDSEFSPRFPEGMLLAG